uniref:Uncharacterized protein n=1 Tax=Roseihalotalea indica TaxID=2867963 RepID=A0AA49JFH0_9BACT|nr:hypothetical protein K4G66_24445 [Tunicatimonas sp. TK19036]
MENYFELLIFLAFAAFSLFSRFLNSKKKPPTRNPNRQPRREFEDGSRSDKPVVMQESTKTKPVSFEEILRDMMGESPQRREVPQAAKKIQKAKGKVSEAQQELEKVKQTAKKAKRIADKVSLEDTGKRIKPIELDEQKHNVSQEVADALRSPRNAREAIILSEIINRKYF